MGNVLSCGKTAPNRVGSEGFKTIFSFSGKSMTPTIREGMQILVESANPQTVKPADIILYKAGSNMVVHRVIRIMQKDQKRIFVTRGDNHAYIDSAYVPEADLMGIVRGAFYKDNPTEDALIKNNLIGILYIIFGNFVFLVRQKRSSIPQFIRSIFKYLVGGFFFTFKRLIHATYLGFFYGLLFFRRRKDRLNSI